MIKAGSAAGGQDQREIERVSDWKVALLGHSCSGKSACLRILSSSPEIAEMDSVFGTGKSPPMQDALKWIIHNTEQIVAVSVHRQLLCQLAEAKNQEDRQASFQGILFVHLYTWKGKLEDRLRRCRPEDNVRAALTSYEEMDAIFRELADCVVDTTDKGVHEIAEEVMRIK